MACVWRIACKEYDDVQYREWAEVKTGLVVTPTRSMSLDTIEDLIIEAHKKRVDVRSAEYLGEAEVLGAA